MLIIKRLRVEIITTDKDSEGVKYGFDFPFSEGLNIIAGQNSRGKTTINSCIYYALGMEELLGAQNDKALDKSLKENFTTIIDEKHINHNILISKVLLEISNSVETKTIERYIKSSSEDIRLCKVYSSNIDEINEAEITKLFVRGNNNNENENGFYNWLSEFIGIELPTVINTSKKDGYSPLYMQTIFSSIFIEQTKGWSDFFATMPYFGIPKAKEKIVEFTLNLNELETSIRKDDIFKEKNQLSEEWSKKIKSLELITSEYNGEIQELPKELTVEKSEIDKIKVIFKTDIDEVKTLKSLIESKKDYYEFLKNKPISKIQDNRIHVLRKFEHEKEEYKLLRKKIDDFSNNLNLQKLQFENLSNQKEKISKEIKNHNSLIKVFDENFLNRNDGNVCPTCTQEVSYDLISSEEIDIPKLSLEENKIFLVGQEKLIQTSLKSLIKVVEEKDFILKYYKKNLRNKEELIKSLSNDLIADDRDFSESDVLKKVQLEKEINELNFISEKINQLLDELKLLAIKYHNNLIKLDGLKDKQIEDENKLKEFAELYKNYLFYFEYDSNERWEVIISDKEPFKYFPVYQQYKEAPQQSIRINSSASDFVRNIWAYTLALLNNGLNHPGIVMFDEPGQHKTKMSSLEKFFEVCSTFQDRQVIIFTSVDKVLDSEENEKLDIYKILNSIPQDYYNLIELDENSKAIKRLKN
jgi:DNA repair exonuclease SbcCD ATPase subunit